VDPLVKLLFPTRCIFCGQLQKGSARDICPACRNTAAIFTHTPWKIPHVRRWVTLWQYTGLVRESLLHYKFWHRRGYSVTYARELAQMLRRSDLDYDVVTWVPVSMLRRLERGYDQVEVLAEELGKEMGPVPIKALYKHRHNRRQSGIQGLEARRENVRGVYRPVRPERFEGKRVLLLEDIITTGATVSECAKVLKAAGAKEVCVACVAVAARYKQR